MPTGMRLRVADSVVAPPVDPPPPGVEWEPIGPAITQAKVESAGVTTGHMQGANMNISFCSVFQNPSWWTAGAGLKDWLMVFASHRGRNVLLAHADNPFDLADWAVVGTVVLSYETLVDLAADVVPDGVIFPVWQGVDEHLASPEVFVDDVNERFLLMVHAGQNSSRANMGQHVGYGLYTDDLLDQSAYSIHGPVGGAKTLEYREYARFTPKVGQLHGTDQPLIAAELNQMARAAAADWYDQTATVGWNSIDPSGFDGLTPPDQRIRHSCVYWLTDTLVRVYYTVNGGVPERVESMLVDLVDPATLSTWRAREGSHVDERFPLLDWEGFGLGGIPSTGSAALSPVEQLRDPHVINVGADRAMFCSVRGEYGIGVYRMANAAVYV